MTSNNNSKKHFIIFKCPKCKQFSYFRKQQKTKKCLRCGKVFQVSKLTNIIDEVIGHANAVKLVKELQNNLLSSIQDLGPNFHATDEKILFLANSTKIFSLDNQKISRNHENNLEAQFLEILIDLRKQYKRFPKYLIDILVTDRGLSLKGMDAYLRKLIRLNKISISSDGYYLLKNL
ncbi:MAG: DUF1922 domain-containing protein [Promethearchaeota archaeon]